MKKEYIQPKAKEIKIELLSMVATSLEMGGSTIQNDLPNLKCDMEKLYNNYRTDEFKPNDETFATMKEIDEMEKHPEMHKGNTDINAMFDEILKDS